MDLLKKLILGIRFTGLKNVLRTLRYALYRDRLEKQLPPESTEEKLPGRMGQYRSVPGGAEFQFEHAHLEVHFLKEDMVRITWTPGVLPVPYALAGTEYQPVQTILHDTGMTLSVGTSKLEVFVSEDGSLNYLDGNGNLLRSETPPLLTGSRWTLQSRTHADELIYGLGERAASLNLKGGSYRCWNTDPGGAYDRGSDPLYVGIPLYISKRPSGSYLLFYENSFDSTFTFPEADGETTVTFQGGALRSYFFPGELPELVTRYTELTGRSPLPPRWSLGFHQCRWGYETSQDVREVIDGFKQRGLPISAFHMDIDYMDGFRIFTYSPERYGNFPELVEKMHANDIKAVTIVDPGVMKDRDYRVFKSGLEQDVFCKTPAGKNFTGLVWPGWVHFPDFTFEKGRQWWGEQYEEFLNIGIDGFWHDMNEPANFTAWGEPTIPVNIQNELEGRGGDQRQAHNLYGLQMNRAGYEMLRKQRPDKRPWIVSRSGWAGLQRYSWNWTADIDSTWDNLRLTIPMVLNLGLSGVSYTGPDIGGFTGNPTPEMFTRWFQMAAFMPFFRNHAARGTDRREPWVFDDPIPGILKHFLELRGMLMPYIYSLAYESSQTGWPLNRPLSWYSDAPEALACDDQFFLGENLLIAPVYKEGAKQRSVYLPEGSWHNFWTGELLAGGQIITCAAPLEFIPVFVRSGCALPLKQDGHLLMRIYPSVEPEFRSSVYLDAGDGYGDYRLDTYSFGWEDTDLLISMNSQGNYQVESPEMLFEIVGLALRGVLVDGQEIAFNGSGFKSSPFERARILMQEQLKP